MGRRWASAWSFHGYDIRYIDNDVIFLIWHCKNWIFFSIKIAERVYEDHELLVENLLLWTRDSKNKLLFVERPDKTQLFLTPEIYLLGASDRSCGEYDEHSRNTLLEEFYSSSNIGVPEVIAIREKLTVYIEVSCLPRTHKPTWAKCQKRFYSNELARTVEAATCFT